jgi:hypothetical protein
VFHYCQADWKNLHNDLTIGLSSILPESMDNDSSHNTTVDINIVWQRWRNCLLNAATRHIPTKVVKRRNTPPWFDNETCRAILLKGKIRHEEKQIAIGKTFETYVALLKHCMYVCMYVCI